MIKHASYMKMSERELRNHLAKRFPAQRPVELAEIERIIATVQIQQREALVQKGEKREHGRMWRELLNPCKNELRIVERMLAYNSDPDTERTTALTDYRTVLQKLLIKFEVAKRTPEAKELTARQVSEAHELKKRTIAGMPVPTVRPHYKTPRDLAQEASRPNGGTHWTDWVAPSAKARVTALFEAIPHTPHAKRKVPFERTIPKQDWAKLRNRLLKRTTKELDAAEFALKRAEMELDPTLEDTIKKVEKRRATVGKIKQALTIINDMPEGEAMPVTWHGFFTNTKELK